MTLAKVKSVSIVDFRKKLTCLSEQTVSLYCILEVGDSHDYDEQILRDFSEYNLSHAESNRRLC
jgi:hypothetical protein